MSSFVKLLTNNYMGYQKHEYALTMDGYGLQMEAAETGIILGGKEHGKEISLKDVIKAGTTVQVFPRIAPSPRKYALVSSYNFNLFSGSASVCFPAISNPKSAPGIYAIITFYEDTLIPLDTYVFEFYLID